LIAGALDWLALRRRPRAVFRWLWPWLMLAGACALWTKLAQPASDVVVGAAWWQRPLVAADALNFYLAKLVWPVWLRIDYGRRPAVVLQHRWAYVARLVLVTLALVLWLDESRATLDVAWAHVFCAGR